MTINSRALISADSQDVLSGKFAEIFSDSGVVLSFPGTPNPRSRRKFPGQEDVRSEMVGFFPGGKCSDNFLARVGSVSVTVPLTEGDFQSKVHARGKFSFTFDVRDMEHPVVVKITPGQSDVLDSRQDVLRLLRRLDPEASLKTCCAAVIVRDKTGKSIFERDLRHLSI